jgi:hypothetical protein
MSMMGTFISHGFISIQLLSRDISDRDTTVATVLMISVASTADANGDVMRSTTAATNTVKVNILLTTVSS